MSLNLLGLGMVFEATDHAGHVIHELEEKIEHLAKSTGVHVEHMDHSFKTLGTGLGAMIVGFEGLEKTFELAEAASKGEQALLELQSTSHLTADELDRLTKAAIAATDHTKFTKTTGIQSLHALMLQGFDTTQAIDLLRASLLLAADSKGQLAPDAAATGLAQVMRTYGIETKHAGLAVDQMVKGIKTFGMEAGVMPDALRLADRGARAANQSMTEVLMTIGLSKDVFGSQTRAATMLGKEMAGLANPKTQLELKKLGLGVAVFDKAGQFRPFLDVVADIGAELALMSDPKRAQWLENTFGEAPAVGVLIDELDKRVMDSSGHLLKGAKAAAYLREGFRNVGPDAEHMLHTLESGFEGSLEQVEKLDTEIRGGLGAGFTVVFKPILDLVAKAMQGFLDIIRATPMPVKVAAAAFIVASFGLTLLTGALMTLKAGWPLFLKGFEIAKLAVTAFGKAAWLANAPMLPWIAAIAAVGAVVYMVHENVLGFGDAWKWLMSLWDIPLLKGLALAVLGVASSFFILGNAVVIGDALAATTAAVWRFNVALLANPITWLVVGLVAIGTLLYAIRSNWRGLGDDFSYGIDQINKKLAEWTAWFKPIAKMLEDAWNTANKFFGASDKKPVPVPKDLDRAPLETSYWSVPRTGQGMGGKVLGSGMGFMFGGDQAPDPNLHDPASHAAGVAGAGHDPGAASAEQMQQMMAEAAKGTQHGESAAFDYAKLSAAVSAQPIHIGVDIDGERVGEAVVKAQRGSAARSGHPVPPH